MVFCVQIPSCLLIIVQAVKLPPYLNKDLILVVFPSFQPRWLSEGTLGTSFSSCLGVPPPSYQIAWMERLDGNVALLTSDQVTDQPSNEPSLSLSSFTSSRSRMVKLRMDVFVISRAFK